MFALNRKIVPRALGFLRAMFGQFRTHELFFSMCVSIVLHLTLVMIIISTARPDAVEIFIKKRRVFVPSLQSSVAEDHTSLIGNEYEELIKKLGLIDGLLPEDDIKALLQISVAKEPKPASKPVTKKAPPPKKPKKEVKKSPGNAKSKSKMTKPKPVAPKKGAPKKSAATNTNNTKMNDAKQTHSAAVKQGEDAGVPPQPSVYIAPSVFKVENVVVQPDTAELAVQTDKQTGIPGAVASEGTDDGIIAEDIISIATEASSVHPWARDEERSIALAREISGALNAQLCLALSIDHGLLTVVKVIVGGDGKVRSVEVVTSSGVPIRDAEIKRAVGLIIFPREVWGRVLELSR